jgi:nitrite reductase/ring-hydroxylating ferredoxin subunit
MSAETIVAVADVADLARGPKVVRVGPKQIALFRVEDRFYAVDNRCPHMGYPLAQGALRGETLTCDWHNWKFNLADGECILRGSEDVRVYPVSVVDGRVCVDLAEVPVEVQMTRHLESLTRGLKRFDTDAMARDAARLMALGMRPAEVMRQGALHNAEREEFGWGHALAVIADCVSLSEYYDEADGAIPVVRALWSASEPVRHYRLRPHAEPVQADLEGEAEFRRRIEVEDVDGAEAWLRGAIDGGLASRELSRWLVNAASDHFLGFGHQAIYVFKAHQLAEEVGWDALAPALPSIVPSIAWATRYDRLPEMRKYMARLKAVEPTLPSFVVKQQRPRTSFDADRFRNEVLFGTGDEAFEAVHGALRGGVHVDLLARELGLAASERLLRMDLDWEVSHDERVWDEGGWLEITHLLTHANATRQILRRGVTPEALRNLYHTAWFINYQKRFDRTDGASAERSLPPVSAESPDEMAAVYRQAVQDRDFEGALGAVRGWEAAGWPTGELLKAMGHEAVEADDGEFIMIAHVLKTTHAAIQEHRSNGVGRPRFLPLLAATRFIASPRKQRSVYDSAMNGTKFIKAGAARTVDPVDADSSRLRVRPRA